MSSSSPVLGIDFGTTKTVAAIYQDGRPQILWGRSGKRAMPSRVVLTKNNKLFAGWDTENLAGGYDHQTFTINAIKRSLGKQGETNWGWWKTRPQEIAALLFGRLKIEIEAGLQAPVNQAVIAIPAHFDINQRWAVQQAAEIAGFRVLRLLNEATAAAICYSQSQHRRDGKILVFDFGGGTLDVSVVELDKELVEVLGTAGDGQLGGEDVDDLLLQWVQTTVRSTRLPDFSLASLGHSQQIYLRRQVVSLKEALSQNAQAQLQIPGFLQNGQNFEELNATLSRNTFNSVCSPLFERIALVVRNALAISKVKPAELNSVLMIGGSSRIPRVREIVTQLLGQNIYQGLDSEISVALGAATQAGVLGGQLKDFLLIDALPADFSIGLGKERSIIFERGEAYPISKKKSDFTTSQDYQQVVEIPIYEHPPGAASEGNLLGQVTLPGLLPALKGVPKIEVEFKMDVNGLLTVKASETVLKREISTTLVSPYRLNDAQMQAIRNSLKVAFQDVPQEAFHPFQKEAEVEGGVHLRVRDLDAEAGQLLERLRQIQGYRASLFLDLKIPIDAWFGQLRARNGLDQQLGTIRAELARALPKLLAGHIQDLGATFLFKWAGEVRKRLAQEVPLATTFAAIDQRWLEAFDAIRSLGADPTRLYRAAFEHLPNPQDRWTLGFILRHTWPHNKLEKAQLFQLIENRAVSKDQAVAIWLRELVDMQFPERQDEALRILGELLSPQEITGLLLQFRTAPAFQRTLSASLHASVHKMQLPALVDCYFVLSVSGQALWREHPGIRKLTRKALIRRLQNTPTEKQAAIRAALSRLMD